MPLTYATIAKKIDHALLLPTMTEAELIAGCRLASEYDVASVCIKPYAVPLASQWLRQSDVKVGTVIGFPHGGQSTACKLAEAIEAVEHGAAELDMVVNIGSVLSSRWEEVESEIQQVTAAAHGRAALIKVIFETCYLTDAQKIELCGICGRAGVDFVKTSTGFGSGGATMHDLELMKAHSPNTVKLKASGGIKTLDAAIEYAEMGCTRLGLSKTAEILDELRVRLGIDAQKVSRGTERQAGSAVDY